MAIGVLAMSASERERLKMVAQVAERAAFATGGGGAVGDLRSAGAAACSGVSRERRRRAFVAPAGAGLEPSARLGRLRAREGPSERQVSRFWSDVGGREAGGDRGDRGVARDGAAIADQTRRLEAEGAATQEGVSTAPAASALWRTHPDRWQSARLVR